MKNGGWGGFHTPFITNCYNYILSLTLIQPPHFTPHGSYLRCLMMGIQYYLGVGPRLGRAWIIGSWCEEGKATMRLLVYFLMFHFSYC